MGELLRGYTSKDENHGAGTATSSTSSSSQGTAHAPAGSPKGGQFTTGSNGGGSKPAAKPAPRTKPTPKPADYKPVIPVVTKTGPMKLGSASNDPAQVKQLQALLGVLGLGTPPTDGNFDDATKAAVMEAQKRLGLKQTGTASTTLLNKLIAAHALSPCVNRSADVGDEYELLRAAVARGDFDTDEEDRGRLIVRSGEILRYQRFWPLEDIEISRSHTDGRTVVAYATVFDTPYPVSDQYGEYDETVERSAFNKWLADGNISRAMCLYNHGYTIHGSPSDAYSVPLGQPLEITPDGRGLKTITRYNKGPDVDRVLEAISNHAITGQSFRGRIVRSTPPNNRRYATARDGARTMVVRHELGLTDYGPTPMPVNAGAEILAVRSLAAQLGISGDQLAELIRTTSTTPDDWEPETDSATSDLGAGTDEPPAEVARHSTRQSDIARRIFLARRSGRK